MAISLVASATFNVNNNPYVCNKPADTVEDDVMIAWITTENRTPDDDTSWTIFASTSPLFNSAALFGLYKIAGPSEPSSYNFQTQDDTGVGGILTFRGVDLDSPLDGTATEVVNDTPETDVVTLPSITTTVDGCMLTAAVGSSGSPSVPTVSPPSGMTEVWDLATTRVSDNARNAAAYELLGAAGATGTRSFNLSYTEANGGIMVALRPGCIAIHPDPLFIPHKDRLSRLADEFTEAGISVAIIAQFDNWKVIERWAESFMRDTLSPERCILTIPYKEHSAEPWEDSARQSFENWKAVERWAGYILDGSCGCNCGTTERLPARCQLFVPYKDALSMVTDPTDRWALEQAAEAEFDNFKALERWARAYAAGECACTHG